MFLSVFRLDKCQHVTHVTSSYREQFNNLRVSYRLRVRMKEFRNFRSRLERSLQLRVLSCRIVRVGTYDLANSQLTCVRPKPAIDLTGMQHVS